MAANRFQRHVVVLPEDDANSQLAIGFRLELDQSVSRAMWVLRPSGGWIKVLNDFESIHIADMGRNDNRYMVLLIDFDSKRERLNDAKRRIPQHLTERVFILGVLNEPEDLKADLETIGSELARDCREGTDNTWAHPLLQHNTPELDRLREHVRSILFPSP